VSSTVPTPARQAAWLFAAGGVLRLAAIALPGSRVAGLLVVGLVDLLIAAVVRALPWRRWPGSATLTLAVPAFAVIVTANAEGLVPARLIAVLFVLVFAWVGSNHRRWASLWVAPLAATAYVVAMGANGPDLDYRAPLIVTAVCVLVAETVARSQDRLRVASAELAFLAEHTTDLVTRTDLQGVIRYVSPSVLVLLGWRPEQLVGHCVSEFSHAEEPMPVLVGACPPGEPVTVVRRLLRADGGWSWFEWVAQVVTAPDGHPVVLASGRDITGRRRMEAQLAHEATHDSLTGLANRVLLDERLTACLSAARSQPLAVAFLDLDGFKEVNDQQGHEIGDRVLVLVARRLQHLVREHDTVARYGGDEFVLVIDKLPHQRDVLSLVSRVETELTKPYRLGEHTLHIGVSLGLTFAGSGMNAGQVIAAADRAMYATKAARRAGVKVPVPRDAPSRSTQVENQVTADGPIADDAAGVTQGA
jgi:diguanylate cyclase (GGDEF)-like protein/PAS domain S-box-containing protein